MRYLVDTHVLIWAVSRSEKLSAVARQVFAQADGMYFFSPISVWEIAIKHGKHPDDMLMTGKEAARLFREAGFRELKPDAAQCAAVEDLPPIHADPFDRLLIVQAKSMDMKLITHDHLIADYGDVALVV